MRFMSFHVLQQIQPAATALAGAATLGLVVAVLLTGGARSSEAASTLATRTVTVTTPTVVRTVTTREVVTETVATQVGQTVVRNGQASELRYLVKPGDTLWDIAAANYDDVGAGMHAIQRRNGLKRQKVLAGEILLIPIEGAGSSG